MEIIRIPTAYATQIKYLSTEDSEYVLKTLFNLAYWEDVKIEESLRWWLVISIWREAIQMENKARAKKGQERLNEDLATLMQQNSDNGVTLWSSKRATNSNQIKSSQVKSNQTNTNNNNLEENFNKFWDRYPNKKWKQEAKKAFINKTIDIDIEVLLLCVDKYKRETDPKYYKHWSTFINQQVWLDYDLEKAKQIVNETKKEEVKIEEDLWYELKYNFYNEDWTMKTDLTPQN